MEKTKKPAPNFKEGAVECPVCHGIGSYLYQDSTLVMHCRQCNGYGWVRKGTYDETCVPHTMVFVANIGRCYNRYKCKNCDRVDDIDSSD